MPIANTPTHDALLEAAAFVVLQGLQEDGVPRGEGASADELPLRCAPCAL